jgi:hypothetical protein
VDRLKREVEQLERLLTASRGTDAAARLTKKEGREGQRQLRYALGRSVQALSPLQAQRLQLMLTSPQRALVYGTLRNAITGARPRSGSVISGARPRRQSR